MELREKVLTALEEIRPFLAADGGDISLIDIEDDKIVKVQLQGACAGCSVNQMTLKSGVEMTIKKHAPQIEEVINLEAKSIMADIQISVIDREGVTHELMAPTDMNMNLMEVCKAHELPVEGTCGGMALCASCQCYVLGSSFGRTLR